MNKTAALQEGPGVKPLTVGFADDVEEIQILARAWLVAAGYKVICVADGRQLCQLSQDQHLDIVITDVMMPNTDGFEVIAIIRKTNPNTRIVAISGGGRTMSGEDCLRIARRLGADAVVPKPFKRAQLMQAVDEVAATLVRAKAS